MQLGATKLGEPLTEEQALIWSMARQFAAQKVAPTPATEEDAFREEDVFMPEPLPLPAVPFLSLQE